MASEDRAVRESQNEKAKAAYEARLAVLKERGLDEKAVAKDTVLRNLRAKAKKARGRLVAMDAHVAHVAEMAAKDTKLAKETGKKKKGQPQPQGGKAKGAGAKGAKGKKK